MSQSDEMLLVLLAGQSNMAGRGIATPEDLTAVPGLFFIAKDQQWRPAVEPITRDRAFIGAFHEDKSKAEPPADPFDALAVPEKGYIVGVGPGRTFGRLLKEANPDKTVGLIPTAVGGTPISAWKPCGVDPWDPECHPYDNSIILAKEAMKKGKIAAVLWHQGESDAGLQNPNYKEDLREVIHNFRNELNLHDVPFILGELASFYEPRLADHIGPIDQAMYDLAEEEPLVSVIATKDLDHRGDNLHFDTASCHIMGERYFEAYQKLTGRK